MIFARYEIIPGGNHPNRDRIGITYVNCWLRVRSFVEAKKMAELNITEQRWDIRSLEEIWRVPKGHYQEQGDGLEYYEQALVDREVYVFHQTPKFPVYLIEFEAVPMKTNTHFAQGTIASVKYWIVNEKVSDSADVFDNFWDKENHKRTAISAGRKMIQSEKWRVTEVLGGRPINYLSFSSDPVLSQYYEEAEEHGECIAFWTN